MTLKRTGAVMVFRGQRFLGLRVGPVYLQVKDMRFNKAYFGERYRYGCRYVTVGHWRFLVKKSGWAGE